MLRWSKKSPASSKRRDMTMPSRPGNRPPRAPSRSGRPGMWAIRGPLSRNQYLAVRRARLVDSAGPVVAGVERDIGGQGVHAQPGRRVQPAGHLVRGRRSAVRHGHQHLPGHRRVCLVGADRPAAGAADRHLSSGAGRAGAAHRLHPLHAGGGLHSAGDAVGGHRGVVEDRHHLHRHVFPDGADDGRGRAPGAAGADRGGADHGRDTRRDRSTW